MDRLSAGVILLEIFIQFTQPGGHPIWIEEMSITTIREERNECHQHANAIIVTSTGKFCVMESPEQVRAKIEATKPH